MSTAAVSTALMTEQEAAERRAFLEGRQRGIGSSDVYRIFTGEAVEVYHEKTRPITDEDVMHGQDGIHIFRGNVLEPVARRLYFQLTGRRGRAERGQVFHPDYPGAMASPDGTIFSENLSPDAPMEAGESYLIQPEGTGTLELKAPGIGPFHDLVEHGTRESIIYQLQYAIAVRRMGWGGFGFINLEHSAGPIIPIDQVADAPLGTFLLETVAGFWTRHVETRTPPDPEPWALLLEKAPSPTKREGAVKIVEDAEASALLREMMRAAELQKRAEQAKKEAQAELDRWMNEHAPETDRIEIPHVGKATRVVVENGRKSFDADLLAGHRPVDRDAFVRWYADLDAERTDGAEVVFLEEAEKRAEELALDLSRFEKRGAGYSFLRTTPAK